MIDAFRSIAVGAAGADGSRFKLPKGYCNAYDAHPSLLDALLYLEKKEIEGVGVERSANRRHVRHLRHPRLCNQRLIG